MMRHGVSIPIAAIMLGLFAAPVPAMARQGVVPQGS
jgi:hypothetical protein